MLPLHPTALLAGSTEESSSFSHCPAWQSFVNPVLAQMMCPWVNLSPCGLNALLPALLPPLCHLWADVLFWPHPVSLCYWSKRVRSGGAAEKEAGWQQVGNRKVGLALFEGHKFWVRFTTVSRFGISFPCVATQGLSPCYFLLMTLSFPDTFILWLENGCTNSDNSIEKTFMRLGTWPNLFPKDNEVYKSKVL